MATPDPSAAMAHALGAFGGIFWIFVLAVIIFIIVLYWRIATKAGYSGALSLLMFIPLVNLVMLILFAFSEWPIQQRLRALEANSYVPPAPPPGTTVMPT